MNILLINSIHQDIWGGGEKKMIIMGEGLRGKGRSVAFCGQPKSKFLQQAKESGFATFPVRIHSDYSPAVIFRLARYFSVNHTDIAVVNFTKEAKLAGLAAKLAGNTLVVAMHGLPILTNKFEDRQVFSKLISGIIVNTDAFKRQYLTYGWVDEQDIEVIHNGLEVDIEKNFDRQLTKNKFDLPDKRPVIGFFGRLTLQKQPRFLLDAAKAILSKFPNAIFLIVGQGPEEENIKKYSEVLGIRSHIYLLGMQKEVFPLYDYCDLVLLTSAYEGMPNIMLESMLMETPVVAFDVGGVREVIPDREAGIVVPKNDVAQLAEQATALLKDDRQRQEMGRKARKFIRKEFPIFKMIDHLDLYLQRLAATKNQN